MSHPAPILASEQLLANPREWAPPIAGERDGGPAADRLQVQHVITGLNYGGAEILLARLLAELAETRVESRVLSLLAPGPVAPSISRLAVPIDTLMMPRALPRPRHLSMLARYARNMPAFGTVQGWMYHGNLAATALQLLRPTARLFWSIHHSITNLGDEKRLSRNLIRLSAQLSSRPEAIVYVSEASALQHEALGFDRRRRIIIPNGVDARTFRPRPEAAERLRQLLGVPPERKIIGAVGRNHPMKDHPRLIHAVAAVRAQGLDVHLVFIGEGVNPSVPDIGRALSQTGMDDRISFLGARSDIASLVAGFDLFVSSSAFGESCPVVLLEAMASAIPCVATDLGDCRKILGPAGTIVAPRDTSSLTAAICEWIGRSGNERRAAGDAARKRVLDHYTLDTMLKRYRGLWRATSTKPGGAP